RRRSAGTPPASTPMARVTRKAVSIPLAVSSETPYRAVRVDGRNDCNPAVNIEVNTKKPNRRRNGRLSMKRKLAPLRDAPSAPGDGAGRTGAGTRRSEEHTSEL